MPKRRNLVAFWAIFWYKSTCVTGSILTVADISAAVRIGCSRVRHIETTMHYVYILLNETKTKMYTGVADDVNKRLALHNAGRVKASRPYRPYKIIHTESFEH
jgi:hypothetical protein